MIGIAVLGSTGSIGRQTLEVINAHSDLLEVRGLAAGHRTPLLARQMRAWPAARVWTPEPGPRPTERWAPGGLVDLATAENVELVVVATTGMSALPAVLAAIDSGRRVALANKETLVTGGHLVAASLARRGGDPLDLLRPVDSEHSAIWQCLLGERIEGVERLVLTASGGPFRGRRASDLDQVTPEDALAHPTWHMGPKITVDSATLVNKAFEAIEAKWLYGVPYSKIAAVIHPQSVVHSFVEFVDGSFKAQLGLPDMRLPIQYALLHPRRLASPARHASPETWPQLTFATLAAGDYPAYDTVRRAAAAGGNRGTILNAADEVAVAGFLARELAFPRIGELIGEAVERWGDGREPDLAEIAELDADVRRELVGRVARGVA